MARGFLDALMRVAYGFAVWLAIFIVGGMLYSLL